MHSITVFNKELNRPIIFNKVDGYWVSMNVKGTTIGEKPNDTHYINGIWFGQLEELFNKLGVNK